MAITKPPNQIPEAWRSLYPEISNFADTTEVPGAAFLLQRKLRAVMDGPFRRRQQNIQDLQNTYLEIKNNPVEWTAKNISIPNTQSMNDNAARGIPIPSNVFVSFDTVDTSLATGVGREQVKYLVENNFDLNKLSENIKPVAVKYKLTDQILNQGTSGKWTGMGFGTPEKNALAMADMLSGAGITDIKQFGVLPDGKYGNKTTGQAIDANYTRAGGNIWGGTFEGENSTGFGVQFGPDGTPYFYTQEGASTSDKGKIAPIISLGLTFFAPGIGTAIGTALGATGTAASVIGSAIVQGTLSEIQGGDFLDGAIRGAVTAGVAPVVANTVGTTVAELMGDSAFKSVVSNAIASSASSAVSAALTGGDVGQAALTGALAGAGGSVGRELGTAAEYGTTPFTEQTQMLAGQEQGLGGAGGLGANLGQAAGAVAAGADPTQAIINAIIQTQQEKSAATPDTADQVSPETPVSSPPGAEITTAPPPETGQISDVGLMDGIAGTIPEIDTPSTQEITIPDQITQELGGVQEGIAETIPSLDQELLDLITQPQPELAPVQEVVVPPAEDLGIQEGIAGTIPTEEEIAAVDGSALDVLGQPLTPEAVDIEPIPQDPLLGLSSPSVGEGEQEAIDYQALEGLSSADVGLGEEQAIDQANLDALADLSSAEVGLGEQGAIDQQALEELSSAEVGLGEQQAIEDSFPRIDTTPYIRDTYLSLGRKRPDFGPTVTTLGQALQAPFFPSSPVSGLTSYRGAGEIEGQRTGKPRRNVWNESSLRLTDALGL